MKEELKIAYDFSFKGIIAKITLAMAILSSVRFFIDVFTLSLTSLLRNVLKTYQVVFHTCIDILFVWVPFKIPAWGKDLFILYVMLAFVVARVLYKQAEINFKHPWIIQHNYGNNKHRYWLLIGFKLIWGTLIWPAHFWHILVNPFLVVPNGSHGPGSMRFENQRPRYQEPQPGIFNHRYIGDARLMMAMRLTVIFVCAALVLLFNYAFST